MRRSRARTDRIGFIQQQKTQLADLQRQRAQSSEKLGPRQRASSSVRATVSSRTTGLQRFCVARATRSLRSVAVCVRRSCRSCSGCKTAIGTRLKRSGMHWTVAGADAIIALRCCKLSGRFEDFWERRSEAGSRTAA
ncbi:MAG: hypothetical protein HY701_02280 [Gemmatimonadetes bacterium]|nr:hypothetical protein [Gemmatimonadota bacterium]